MILSEVAASFRFPAAPATVSGEGVHLRRFNRRHLRLLVRASHDPEIVRWTFIPSHLDSATADALFERWRVQMAEGRLRPYVISAGPSRPAMGLVSLVLQDHEDPALADIFYWLLPEGRGRGLVSRAVRLLLDWGFEQGGVPRVALYTKEGNLRSDRVAERSGFRDTGIIRRHRRDQTYVLRRWLLDAGQHASQGR